MRKMHNWKVGGVLGLLLALVFTVSYGLESPDLTDIGTGALRFSFVIVTDIHNNQGRLQDLVNWVNTNKAAYKIRFVAIIGDLTHQANVSPYPSMKGIFQNLTVPALPIPGNHDIADPASGNVPNPRNATEKAFHEHFWQISPLLDNFTKAPTPVSNPEANIDSYFQNFAFDIVVDGRRYHFIFLDFCARKPGGVGSDWWLGNADLHDFPGGTYRWLMSHLSSYFSVYPYMKNGDRIFLFSHHPPSIAIFGPGDYKKLIGDSLMQYQNAIGYWFAGHTHMGEEYNVKWGGRTLCRAVVTDALGGWSSDNGHFRVVRVRW